MDTNVFTTLRGVTRRRLTFAAILVALIIIIGAVGFRLLEGVPWLDAFYLAVQTVTTVGYGDVSPQTPVGRAFAIALMLAGVGLVLYALTVLAQAVLQSEIVGMFDARRRMKEMRKLEGHYIVCGAGRVGRRIIRSLQREKLPYVVVEHDNNRLAELDADGWPVIVGDATLEDNLLTAGVRNACGLAACLPDDAANVYVVLTARGLNKDLHIVARAVEEQAEPTLIRAGANRVVAPTIIGSQSMARSLLKPAIADFMDSIVAETMDLVFEEVAIDSDSKLCNKSLKDTDLMKELNLIVVAIRKKDGEMQFQPSGSSRIEEGDLLIVIGKAESVKGLIERSR